MIACVAPSPAVDRLLEVDGTVQAGGIHRPVTVVVVPGGKGLNVARAAATLGAVVEAIAPLGGFAGRWIAQRLSADGVTVRRTASSAEPRVCVSVAGRDGSLTEFYEPAEPLSRAEWRALERAVRRAGRFARWVTISGSLPPGAPDDGAARLVAVARDGGARVALDAAGIELVDEDGVVRSAAPPVVGAFPVGSGDVTLAALVTERAAGVPWARALATAVAASAASAELPGAGLLLPGRVRSLTAAVHVHERGARRSGAD